MPSIDFLLWLVPFSHSFFLMNGFQIIPYHRMYPFSLRCMGTPLWFFLFLSFLQCKEERLPVYSPAWSSLLRWDLHLKERICFKGSKLFSLRFEPHWKEKQNESGRTVFPESVPTDVQADLTLRVVHMLLSWFSRVAAHYVDCSKQWTLGK